jgi:hypothetical protein
LPFAEIVDVAMLMKALQDRVKARRSLKSQIELLSKGQIPQTQIALLFPLTLHCALQTWESALSSEIRDFDQCF